MLNVALLQRSLEAVHKAPGAYNPRLLARYPNGPNGPVEGCFAAFVLGQSGIGLEFNRRTGLATGLDETGHAALRTAADLLGTDARRALVGGVFDHRMTLPDLDREAARLVRDWLDDPEAGEAFT